MAVEARRACGFRKVGGLYLVGSWMAEYCHRLPWKLERCPTCDAGIKPARGWTWVDATALFSPGCFPDDGKSLTLRGFEPGPHCKLCPVCSPEVLGLGRCGLLWIGEMFYPTPAHFQRESSRLGVCRRLSSVPNGFKVGETWVLLAHRKATGYAQGLGETAPGIFSVFKPMAIECLVTDSQARDELYMEGMRERGIKPVVVPDGDADHQGTVYDNAQDDIEGALNAAR